MELTGLKKNPFVFRYGDSKPPTPAMKEGCMPIAWTETVDFITNAELIKRTALMVHAKEMVRASLSIAKVVRFTVNI